MRLFVFEGEAEERLFRTLKHLFLNHEDEVVCVFRSNIYALYSRLKKHSVFEDKLQDSEFDTVSVLNDILLDTGDHTLERYVEEGSVFAEVFLFFDYDLHHHRGCTLQDNNVQLMDMLNYFSDESDAGKLYINYPMVEAYRYIKNIPDVEYVNYAVGIEQCKDFKKIVSVFSKYGVDHFALSDQEWKIEEKMEPRLVKVKENWIGFIPMNVSKANFICHDINGMPSKKSDVSQILIFEKELEKYVLQEPCSVSVLSSFPLFLYEYLKPEVIGLSST